MPYPCGAAHFVKLFACQLSQAGHDVWVAHCNPKAQAVEGLKLHQFTGPGLSGIIGLCDFLKQEKFDRIDLQYENFMFQSKPWAFLMPLMLGKNSLWLTMHSAFLPRPHFLAKIYRLLQMLLFKKVILYSQVMACHWQKKFPHKAQDYLPLGFPSNITIDTSAPLEAILKKYRQENEDGLMGVYFGHIDHNRGIEDIINALEVLKQKTDLPLRFNFLGLFDPANNYYHQNLTSLIEEKNLSQVITFTNRLSDSEVSLALRSCDYAVLPFPEGAGAKNGSLSAILVHGLPVITTLSSQTDDFIANSKALLFYKAGHWQELVSQWQKLLSQKELQKEMAHQALQEAKRFSWQYYIKKRLDYYQH